VGKRDYGEFLLNIRRFNMAIIDHTMLSEIEMGQGIDGKFLSHHEA
jgi:hypothetical protein